MSALQARSDAHAATRATGDWSRDNQQYLRLALDATAAYFAPASGADAQDERDAARQQARRAQAELAGAMTEPPALETLCASFGLSPFERDVLLLAAGVELDGEFRRLIAGSELGDERGRLTLSLALAVASEPHWSALTPESTLRRWRLIEVAAGDGLMFSPVRIDERVLHYLLGLHYLDDRLTGLIARAGRPGLLAPSHARLGRRIAVAWRTPHNGLPPVVQLVGASAADKRAVAAAVSDVLGCDLYAIPAAQLPADGREHEALLRLWEREALLSRLILLVECDELDAARGGDEGQRTGAAEGWSRAVDRLVEGMGGWLFVSTREARGARARQMLSFEVARPAAGELDGLWRGALGPLAERLNGHVERVSRQFQLDAPAIAAVGATTAGQLADGSEGQDPGELLWEACRTQCRTRMDELAQRIETRAKWADLVLPPLQLQALRELAAQVRQREKVYGEWGFGANTNRGLGISALFAGASGTGKTLAAEVLANELRLDLYRIDLSQVVSKYIGETEKNLRKVFDAAEQGGAVLLFDEADALFGKRSEVKDSHDRYANIEVSYLLQRMEAYRGLAILTTNLKSSLDQAFLRRLRFIVDFPFPDAGQRAEIWRRMFPPAAPVERVDVGRLARLNVPGGNIRNIALNAAFLAADAGEPIRMAHLLRASQIEYAKLDKPLPAGDVSDWG